MADEPIFERRLDLAASLDSIAAAQEEIEAAADGIIDGKAVFRLTMSVEELMTNVVRHGCQQGPIGVLILVTSQAFSVELSDGGPAYDPFSETPAPALDAALEDRPIGGLGVHLVRNMVDGVEYRRIDGQNVTRLTMLRTKPAADGEDACR